MADTSLGRASLSVTADLSSFTSAMDSAASKTNGFNKANNLAADSTRKLMDAADKTNKINTGSKAPPKVAKVSGGMKITDMMGIGFFTAAFTKVFDGAMALVKSLVSGVVAPWPSRGHRITVASAGLSHRRGMVAGTWVAA